MDYGHQTGACVSFFYPAILLNLIELRYQHPYEPTGLEF